MATIRRLKTGAWQAKVRRKGQRPLTKTFSQRSDAVGWSSTVESEMHRGMFLDRTVAERTTVDDVLTRYEKEVAPQKRSQAAIRSRIKHLREGLGCYAVAVLNSTHLAQYRDTRLQKVSSQSVRHELNLLHRVLVVAQIDWGIVLPQGVPPVRKPRTPAGRERRLLAGEEERLLAAFKRNPVMKRLVLFTLETGMRRGELAAMRWEHVDRAAQVLLIPETKTDMPRTVPLSSSAVQVLAELPRRLDGLVFGLRPDSITQAFDRACRRAGIEGLHFHDLRHETASRLFEKGLNVMEVSSVTGHRDLRMLKRYTHLKAIELAKRLE